MSQRECFTPETHPLGCRCAFKVMRDIDAKAAIAAPADTSMTQTQEPKPTYPVGVSVLVTCDGWLLLGERINCSAAGLLSTPGGRVEPSDADVIAAAIRELAEETDIAATPSDLRLLDHRKHDRFGQHYFMFYVHMELSSLRKIENRIPDKSKEWKWYAITDAANRNTTEPAEIVAKLIRNQLDPINTAELQAKALRDAANAFEQEVDQRDGFKRGVGNYYVSTERLRSRADQLLRDAVPVGSETALPDECPTCHDTTVCGDDWHELWRTPQPVPAQGETLEKIAAKWAAVDWSPQPMSKAGLRNVIFAALRDYATQLQERKKS
jgi:8-oxo-dGTP pyrophosphatase MutT (NUDIX family)